MCAGLLNVEKAV